MQGSQDGRPREEEPRAKPPGPRRPSVDTYLPVVTANPGAALALAYTRDQSVEVQQAVANTYPWRPDLGNRISEAGTSLT